MEKPLTVPADRDLVVIKAPGHTRVRIVDAAGQLVFQSLSEGSEVHAALPPGKYTLETDARSVEVAHTSLGDVHRAQRHDALHPPRPPAAR